MFPALESIHVPGIEFTSAFTVVLWARPVANLEATLFSKGFLSMKINSSGQLCASVFLQSTACTTAVHSSEFYLDKWGLFGMVIEHSDYTISQVRLILNDQYEIMSNTYTWDDFSFVSIYITVSASALFYYSLEIYDGFLLSSDFVEGNLFLSSVSENCVYPPHLTACLSTADSTMNAAGDTCDPICLTNGASCLTSSTDCIECPAECSGSCSNIVPYDCITDSQLCFPYAYSVVDLACSTTDTCSANCGACEVIAGCTQCTLGYVLLPDNTCDLSCPGGYFASSGVCELCHVDCATCTGSTQTDCLTCATVNSELSGSSCQCSPGYFEATSNPLSCSQCHTDCAECLLETELDCTVCADQFASIDPASSTCICNSGYFSDGVACQVCSAECATCTGSAQYCLTCTDPFSVADTGLCSCIASYVELPGSSPPECIACSPACLTCEGTDPSFCLSCIDPSMTASLGECICGSGSFQDPEGAGCLPCHNDCLTCTGATEFDCIDCSDPNAAVEATSNECVCNGGYYYDAALFSCQLCDTTCSLCSGPLASDCVECSDPNASVDAATNECVCDGGYFYDVVLFSCQLCDATCSLCSGPLSGDCVGCSDPNAVLDVTTNECVCNGGYYYDVALFSCQLCDATCSLCSGPLAGDCVGCSDPNAVLDVTTNECVCNEGYYYDITLFSCQLCDATCSLCSGPLSSDCVECSDLNAALDATTNECVCNGGYYYDAALLSCQLCDAACSLCFGPLFSDCVDCSDPNAAVNTATNECVCNGGYYYDIILLSCQQCNAACSLCSGSLSDDCVCLDGLFFDTVLLSCELCDPSCAQCSGPEPSECLQCADPNASVVAGECLCNSGTYVNLSECVLCEPQCAECDELGCTSCSEDMVLASNTCECPPDLIWVDAACLETFSLTPTLVDNSLVVIQSSDNWECVAEQLTVSIIPEFGVSSTLNQVSPTECKLELVIDGELPEDSVLVLQFAEDLMSANNKRIESSYFELLFAFDQAVGRTELTNTGIASASNLAVSLGISAASMITLDDPRVLWTVAGIAQIVSYLPLLNISLSEECYDFLRSYQSVIFLPNYALDLVPQRSNKPPLIYQIYGALTNEYTDKTALRNMGRFLTLFLGIVAAYILMWILRWIIPFSRARSFLKNTIKRFIGTISKFWVTLMLDFSVAAVVEVCEKGHPHVSWTTLVTILTFVLCAATPMYLLLAGTTRSQLLQDGDEAALNKFESLFKGLNYKSTASWYYEPLYAIRRLVHAITLYACINYPMAILLPQIFVSLLCIYMLVWCNISLYRPSQIVSILGEVVLIITCVGCVLKTYSEVVDVADDAIEYIMMGANTTFIFAATIISTAGGCLAYLKKKKETKKQTGVVVDLEGDHSGQIFDQIIIRKPETEHLSEALRYHHDIQNYDEFNHTRVQGLPQTVV